MAEEVKQNDDPSSIPKTMRAIICTQIGDPLKVVKLVENSAVPAIKNDCALVKVFYASINPVDYKMVNGMMGFVGKKAPFVTGRDLSGRVVALGKLSSNAKNIKIGDVVYGQSWLTGSMAQYSLVDLRNLEKMPTNISPLNACAVPLVTITSFQALKKTKLKKDEKLLILGGSTATGLAGIQIAKNFIGCSEVVCTSSQEELCKSFGADRVINYKNEKWEEVLKDSKFDVIYDCVGGIKSWDDARSQSVIKKNGHYITIVGDQPHGDELTVGKLLGTTASVINRKFWGMVGQQKYDIFLADSKKNLNDISTLIKNGKFKASLDPESPFKFEEFDKLFKKSMSHRAKGKLILKVSDVDVDINHDNQEQKGDDKKEDVGDGDDEKNVEPKEDVNDNKNDDEQEKEVVNDANDDNNKNDEQENEQEKEVVNDGNDDKNNVQESNENGNNENEENNNEDE